MMNGAADPIASAAGAVVRATIADRIQQQLTVLYQTSPSNPYPSSINLARYCALVENESHIRESAELMAAAVATAIVENGYTIAKSASSRDRKTLLHNDIVSLARSCIVSLFATCVCIIERLPRSETVSHRHPTASIYHFPPRDAPDNQEAHTAAALEEYVFGAQQGGEAEASSSGDSDSDGSSVGGGSSDSDSSDDEADTSTVPLLRDVTFQTLDKFSCSPTYDDMRYDGPPTMRNLAVYVMRPTTPIALPLYHAMECKIAALESANNVFYRTAHPTIITSGKSLAGMADVLVGDKSSTIADVVGGKDVLAQAENALRKRDIKSTDAAERMATETGKCYPVKYGSIQLGRVDDFQVVTPLQVQQMTGSVIEAAEKIINDQMLVQLHPFSSRVTERPELTESRAQTRNACISRHVSYLLSFVCDALGIECTEDMTKHAHDLTTISVKMNTTNLREGISALTSEISVDRIISDSNTSLEEKVKEVEKRVGNSEEEIYKPKTPPGGSFPAHGGSSGGGSVPKRKRRAGDKQAARKSRK